VYGGFFLSLSVKEKIFWAKVTSLLGVVLVLLGVTVGVGLIYPGNPIGILIMGLGFILVVLAATLRFCSDYPKNEDDGGENNINKDLESPEQTDPQVNTAGTENNQEGSSSNSDRLWKDLCCLEKAFKLVGVIILTFGLSYVIWVANLHQDLYGLSIIGVGSFVVVLAATFCLSDKWDLREGEFRKALTISVGAVYFYSLAVADKLYTYNSTSNLTGGLSNATIPWNSTINHTTTNATLTTGMTQWTIVEPLFNNLWAVFLLIITFYFTTVWIEKYQRKK